MDFEVLVLQDKGIDYLNLFKITTIYCPKAVSHQRKYTSLQFTDRSLSQY